jgi:hypothetical protein
MQAILQASDKLTSLYHQNDNNELWSQRMCARYSNKIMSLKQQVCKQDREDARYLDVFHTIYRECKIKRFVVVPNLACIDIIKRGFLTRYPHYCNQLMDLIKSHIPEFIELHLKQPSLFPVSSLYGSKGYTTIKLAIIFNRMDILELLFNSSIYDKSMEHISYGHIRTILKYRRFELLPLFEDYYYYEWIWYQLNDSIERNFKYILTTKMTPIQVTSIITFLTKCIAIIIDKYPNRYHVDRFIRSFYNDYCCNSINDIDTDIDDSVSRLIIFLNQQYTDSMEICLTGRHIMTLDSLVKYMISINKFHYVYIRLFENLYYYSEENILDRLKFCLKNLPRDLHISEINALCTKSLGYNRIKILRYLVNRFAISDVTLPTNQNPFIMTYELLHYLYSSNIFINVDVRCHILYYIDNINEIEQYYQLFKTIYSDNSHLLTYISFFNKATIAQFIDDCIRLDASSNNKAMLELLQQLFDSILNV